MICFVRAKFIALCYNYCIYSMYLHSEAPVVGSIYFTKRFLTSMKFSMQCWLTVILPAEPLSPNRHTMSAVPVNRRGVIRVSWTAPTVPSGELPITGYIIRYKVQNSNMFKYWTVMSNFETEVTGLNPGTVYRVYVAGVSAIGRGSYCCEGTPVRVTTYNGKLHHE